MPDQTDPPTGPVTPPVAGRRRRSRALLWGAAGLVVLAVAGGTVALTTSSADADTSTGMLRLAHLAPGTPAVDMYISGPDLAETLVAPGVAYRATSPYLTEPAGTYRLAARAAGAAAASPPALTVSVELPAGTAQTAAFIDAPSSASPELQVLDDQTAPAARGRAQVRVVQAANGVGALDVDVEGGPPLARELFYGSTTPYATVPSGPARLKIRSRLGSTNTTTVPLAESGVTSLFVGREADGQLVVEAVPDAASVASVPGPGVDASTPTTRPGPDTETPRPAPPRVPSVPRGGTGAGLGGLAAPTLPDVAGSWFSADGDQAPPAPRMPLADAVAPVPAGLRPTGLAIPRIGLNSPSLADLRIDYRGALQVPTDFGQVGWYDSSAVPGDPGPAVLTGHVDTRRGPAVFAQLDQLQPGDPVDVPRSDGTTAHFAVDSVEYFPKDSLPTDRVYGPSTSPQLRLLTCGGPFDAGRLSYRDNVVVFASAR